MWQYNPILFSHHFSIISMNLSGCLILFLQVFVYRSWASVMTADQRAELQSRIAKDNHEKLPFKECEKIAKDLNLTLEQVR